VLDALERGEILLDLLDLGAGFVDVGSLRQPEVQQELRARRRREERLIDVAESPE
jgi:hypothetical protein